jgi:signal transduction histidine kinase
MRSEKLALVGRLASSISHEINNPLEAVTNLLFLIQQTATDDNSRMYCQLAQQELKRVSHIVTHTLRFNRQSHSASVERISELLDSALAIYEPRIKSSGSAVERDYVADDRVLCLGSELRQVFANLIGNAFDAARNGGGRLMLRTRESVSHGRRWVRVTIADTGEGMDQATQRRIFEPFFTTKGENGTGLGLWITFEILEKHNARIRVRSSQKSGASGSVFSIWLPAAEAAPTV